MRIRNILITSLILLSAACAKEADLAPASVAEAEANTTTLAGGEADGNFGVRRASGAVGQNDGDAEKVERMIIRNGDLTIVVKSPDETTPDIHGIAQTLGGFIVQASSYGSGENGSTNLTIRVPADGFEQAMDRFRSLGEVQSESITGEDVTEEFVDLKARLKVQRNLEARFLNLLTEADSIEDTLAVERELTRVREEIERMEGRSKFLKDQAAMATIRLNVRSEAVAGESTFGEIGEAFADSGDIIVTVIAGAIRVVAALLPIALMLSIAGFLLIRLFGAIRKRKSA